MIIYASFGTKALWEAVVAIITGFTIAYFLFWVFVHSNDKWYQRYSLIFSVCLTIYYAFSAFGNLFNIISPFFDGCKAVATGVMSIHAWKIHTSDASAQDPTVLVLH
mmetsp:Transcript_2864/g.5976  ORF Transcript_2864/g.5976 Transcript_2864/m.5976 type:complete len:107 (+) Transcript_2864:1-321(+)